MTIKETFLLWSVDVGTTLKCVDAKISHKIKLFSILLFFQMVLGTCVNICFREASIPGFRKKTTTDLM